MYNFFNDKVSDEDYLGYYPYIEAFNYLLTKHNELLTPPLVFGIHGKWGTGKSTFMNLIKKRVDKNNLFYTLDLNPWEYGENQNFITIFLAKLYEEVSTKLKLEGSKSASDFIKAIFKPLKLSLDIKPIKLEYDFSKFSLDEQQKVIDTFLTENFALKESINYILNQKFFDNKKVIIFIDDLDRCSVDKVMEVIESIKLIFNSKNCIFFLGCDISYIESALSIRYEKFLKYIKEEKIEKDVSANYAIKNFSREYLEKIIQIPFYIPVLNGETIKEYIDSVIHGKESNNNHINIREDLYEKFKEDLKDNFISELIVVAELNPRRIKRTLNLTFLNYIFMKYKNNKKRLEIDTKLLSLLSILREVAPEYYKDHLSNEHSCRNSFKEMFAFLKKEKNKLPEDNIKDDLQLDFIDESLYKFYKLYFQSQSINSTDNLNDKLKNILLYISASNMTTSEGYSQLEWGRVGEIRSDTNNKKLSRFLDKLVKSPVAQELIFWFFNNIFLNNRGKYGLGVVNNAHIYKKDKDGNFKPDDDLIFRFEFIESKSMLFVSFEWRAKFKTVVNDMDKIITTKKYNKANKRIEIDAGTLEKEIDVIKDNLMKMLLSINDKNGDEINEDM